MRGHRIYCKSSRSSRLGNLLQTEIEQLILEKRSDGKVVTNQDIKDKSTSNCKTE